MVQADPSLATADGQMVRSEEVSDKTAPSQANLYRFHAPLSEQYARKVEEQAFFSLSAQRPYTHVELLSCLQQHDETTTSFTKQQV